MVIAQISDTHVQTRGRLAYGRVDTANMLARAVDHVMRLDPRPDVVIATGDLIDGGGTEEYRHLRDLLAPLAIPLYLIPGNHDDRDALRTVFADHAYLPRDTPFVQYVVDDHPLRLVALDTLDPGKTSGLMCPERLAWLEARLAEAPDRPTLILMHHAPFATGLARMDAQGLVGADRMADVVRRHRRIEAIVCGHLHRPIHTRWAGTFVTTAPGTAHQVALDLHEPGALGWVLEPPACLLHLWREGAGLVTHTSYVGDFAGPYPFR